MRKYCDFLFFEGYSLAKRSMGSFKNTYRALFTCPILYGFLKSHVSSQWGRGCPILYCPILYTPSVDTFHPSVILENSFLVMNSKWRRLVEQYFNVDWRFDVIIVAFLAGAGRRLCGAKRHRKLATIIHKYWTPKYSNTRYTNQP